MKRILASATVAALLAGPAFAFDMTKEGYAPVEAGTLEAGALEGVEVYTSADEEIGEVSELILSDDGKVEQAVIDVGGFLGIGEKPVAVPFEELAIMKEADGDDLRVYIDATQESLEDMPAYEN